MHVTNLCSKEQNSNYHPSSHQASRWSQSLKFNNRGSHWIARRSSLPKFGGSPPLGNFPDAWLSKRAARNLDRLCLCHRVWWSVSGIHQSESTFIFRSEGNVRHAKALFSGLSWPCVVSMVHRHEPREPSRLPKSLLGVSCGERHHMSSESTVTQFMSDLLWRAKKSAVSLIFCGCVRKRTWFIKLRSSWAVGWATLSKAQLMTIRSCAGGSCPEDIEAAWFFYRMRRALPGLNRKGLSGVLRLLKGMEWITRRKRIDKIFARAKVLVMGVYVSPWMFPFLLTSWSLAVWDSISGFFTSPRQSVCARTLNWHNPVQLYLSPVVIFTSCFANTTENKWRYYHRNPRKRRQINSKWWPRRHACARHHPIWPQPWCSTSLSDSCQKRHTRGEWRFQ